VPSLRELERPLPKDVVDGHVGVEPERAREAVDAELGLARHERRGSLRPPEPRLEVNAHARPSLDRFDDAVELYRVEDVLDGAEARREVEHAKGTRVCSKERRQDVGVLEIALAAGLATSGLDDETAAIPLVEERREDRLGVEARQAAPHDAARALHERRALTVTDQPHVL
jgi:hypothetical protein